MKRANAGVLNRLKPQPSRLKQQVFQQEALYHLTDSLTRAETLEEIYDSALDSILTALHCDRASLLLTDEAGVMRFKAWRGLSQTYRQAVEGHSPWQPGERNPQPLCIEDVETARLPESFRTAFEKESIKALAFLPLRSRGKLIGKFMVYYSDAHLFKPEEIQLAQ